MEMATEATFKGDLPARPDVEMVEADVLPEYLSTEDCLRLELWALKAEKFERQIADAQRELAAIGSMQQSMAAKYRYDPQKDRVQQANGKIVRG